MSLTAVIEAVMAEPGHRSEERRRGAAYTLQLIQAEFCSRCPFRQSCRDWAANEVTFEGVAAGRWWDTCTEWPTSMVRPQVVTE